MSTAEATNVDDRAIELRNGTMTTRVLVGGQGDPLVYIHGAGGLMWDPFVDALAEQLHGRTPPSIPARASRPGSRSSRDIWDLVLYYNDLLDALELPSAAGRGPLLRRDGGGRAGRQQPRAGRASSCSSRRSGCGATTPPSPTSPASRPRSSSSWCWPTRTARWPPSCTPPVDDPEALFQAAMRMASILHFIWPIPDKGLDRRIHRVQAPTLLVWGKQDGLVPPVYADEFASRLRQAEIVLVDDAGHIPQLEQPVEVREQVLSFLA